MESPRITLITPDDAEAWSATREILRDYSASLQVDLCFQDFEAELASLPGQYEPPGGLMLLALVDGAVAGCGGFRNLPEVDYPNACEMKRLFVRPAFRRFGLGRMLAQALIDRATQAGYSSMLLDTLDDMEAARGLYESLGFEAVPPYYFNPIPGAHYLRVELA
ncbi:GNAT family N-acetyltransferase [Paucibacter aquatile]|jgi:ribosomal protein S18 acetylase RimI-like enzyme|uniref:GNAT family N-acetyltransferase n=1 Tax=Kinneretia aquatilis TaxID=2070761 RepID=A0A2N8L101_9BURK|nr:GNAT family N-acetyltransferase [Paucibacter aquatile]OYU25660.1 MAG: GNAT family N-acetyltransferase [Burkholderiales bacterium PBB2]PND39374.1 GNAT family N-acetyltransferase [Paucibacter aquatile]